ncbi:MAG TPA: hypothetical protein VGR72_09925 [Candidatus Acidoferrales bacterium]|nr:hypothetical protein [Candidatus Acidoferrales bacterium]
MREKAVRAPGLEREIKVRPPKRQSSTPSRHSAKCRICNHPDRHVIEFEFLNWRNPADLARSYRLRDLSTVYRHAHATGLFAKRRLNLRFAMERIVERVNEVPVTASSVIRAARAITRINDEGQWVDPPSHLVIHRQDSSPVGAGLALPAPACPERSRRAQQTNASRGTGSQPVDSSVEVRPRRSSPIFDTALLDEPSDSAAGEMPRIDGKPAPPEIILELTPEFAKCREERNRAIEADRQANAAKKAAFMDNAPTSGNGMPDSEGFVGRGFNRDMNAGSSSSSLLPQAAFPNSASSALPHRTGFENNVADNKENVASLSSTLPEAAPDKPATACPELSRRSEAEALSLPKGGAKQSTRAAGPPLGSSASADPPFPFTQESRRQWKPRRRF